MSIRETTRKWKGYEKEKESNITLDEEYDNDLYEGDSDGMRDTDSTTSKVLVNKMIERGENELTCCLLQKTKEHKKKDAPAPVEEERDMEEEEKVASSDEGIN